MRFCNGARSVGKDLPECVENVYYCVIFGVCVGSVSIAMILKHVEVVAGDVVVVL